jgi:hypothetical protein
MSFNYFVGELNSGDYVKLLIIQEADIESIS